MPDHSHLWVDVGGTFTDLCLTAADGHFQTFKLLSSGRMKGEISCWKNSSSFVDNARAGQCDRLWSDYSIEFYDCQGNVRHFCQVSRFRSSGLFELSEEYDDEFDLVRYEMFSSELAPVTGVRCLLELPLAAPVPPLSVRIGTTRGTNALLERKGDRCALATTAGFADVSAIGHQSRPHLFQLSIQKPILLYEDVVEFRERIDAKGNIIQALDRVETLEKLRNLRESEINSVAICLLHAYANPEHELQLAQFAREAGFEQISISHQVSPRINAISRSDTTLLEAYLNPLLQSYVQQIEESFAGSRVQWMSSAGRLLPGNRFTGKESILSGPAGGVVGFSDIASQEGYSQAIGFDMGGTSTDVCLFAGEFELDEETTKAGVRVATPMLSIETVAAGGGSICAFDGVRLTVGPQSAGAEPGPACYGNGGPLTVTDMNLITGRLIPQQFPFRLDESAASQQLEAMIEQIATSPLGKRYERQELAEGFLEIANATMARAISKISIAKGYDPTEFALVAFGGAGAQHASALARMLKMQRVIVPTLAGVLSAYGMGRATVQHYAEKQILTPLQSFPRKSMEEVFAELQGEVLARFKVDGIGTDQLQSPVSLLSLRSVGTDAPIKIRCVAGVDLQQEYQNRFCQRYGFRAQDQNLEVVSARVEISGHIPERFSPISVRLDSERRLQDKETNVFINSSTCRAKVLQWGDLRSGETIAGPAIICSKTSTILVEDGSFADLTEQGNLILDVGAEEACDSIESTEVDPVQLEIFHQRFASIAEQMGETLRATSRSVNVKERLDFSCAVFDPQGELVANAPHIPVHLGAMSETVKSMLQAYPQMKDGDCYVTNDPFMGGSHLPDVTVISPVFVEGSGHVEFIVASRAHHAEIGGVTPGSMPPFSSNLSEEGVLISGFTLIDVTGEHFEGLRNLLNSGPYPSRDIETNLADLRAQLAANQLGIRLLRELVSVNPLKQVQEFMRQIRKAAAEKTRLALRQLPPGTYSFLDHLDDGSPIAVKIELEQGRAKFDFSGTGKVLSSNLNANRGIVTAAVMYVLRTLIDEEIPLNGGVLEPVTIELPECLLNPPRQDSAEKCAAMVGGNVETSQRVVDVLLGALQLAAGSQGTMNNLTFGNDEFGYYETICGGSGATETSSGADAVHTHMTNTRLTDIEVIENRYPVRIHQFSIRTGSGGRGKYAGGCGIVREIEFLAPLKVSMLSQRRREYRPTGMKGGEAGQPGRNEFLAGGESKWRDMGGSFQIQAQPGDRLRIQTPGGGGWGEPTSNDQ